MHATGSAGTQAGLLAGLGALHSGARVLGISVRHKEDDQAQTVYELARRTAVGFGAADVVSHDAVYVDDHWVGGGYGVPTDATVAAIRTLAATEGILPDPVYTGKAFAGLLGNIAEGRFTAGQNVVFLHTGGSSGLFGYRSAFGQS